MESYHGVFDDIRKLFADQVIFLRCERVRAAWRRAAGTVSQLNLFIEDLFYEPIDLFHRKSPL